MIEVRRDICKTAVNIRTLLLGREEHLAKMYQLAKAELNSLKVEQLEITHWRNASSVISVVYLPMQICFKDGYKWKL